jgi:hypothetical protein
MTPYDEVSTGHVHITASAKTAEPEQPAAVPDQLTGHPVPLVGPRPADSFPCIDCGRAVPRASLTEEPIVTVLDEQLQHVGTGRSLVSRAGVQLTCASTCGCLDKLPDPLTRELVKSKRLRFADWVAAFAAEADPFVEHFAARHQKTTPGRRELEKRAASCSVTPWTHLTRAQVQAIRDEQQAIADAAAGIRRTVAAADLAEKLFAELPGHCERQYGRACWLCGVAAVKTAPTLRDSECWTAVRLTASSWVPDGLGAGSTAGFIAALLCSAGCNGIQHSAGHAEGAPWVWGTAPDACREGVSDFEVSSRALMLAAAGTRVLVAQLRGEPEPEPNNRAWQHLLVGGKLQAFPRDSALANYQARQAEQEFAAARAVAQRAEMRALAEQIAAEASSKTISTASRQIAAVQATADRADQKAQAAKAQSQRAAQVAVSVADRLTRQEK